MHSDQQCMATRVLISRFVGFACGTSDTFRQASWSSRRNCRPQSASGTVRAACSGNRNKDNPGWSLRMHSHGRPRRSLAEVLSAIGTDVHTVQAPSGELIAREKIQPRSSSLLAASAVGRSRDAQRQPPDSATSARGSWHHALARSRAHLIIARWLDRPSGPAATKLHQAARKDSGCDTRPVYLYPIVPQADHAAGL